LRRRALGDETISGRRKFAAASVLRRRCGVRQGARRVWAPRRPAMTGCASSASVRSAWLGG